MRIPKNPSFGSFITADFNLKIELKIRKSSRIQYNPQESLRIPKNPQESQRILLLVHLLQLILISKLN